MSGLKDFREKFGIVSKNSVSRGTQRLRKFDDSSEEKHPKMTQYKLGAYIRLSPSDEIRDEGSLVSHPQRIQSYVDFRNKQTHGWGRIVEWYTDKDLSGKDMNRPALRRMLEDIRDGRINAVIVTELSRLSRSVRDFCQLWDFLKQHNATFLSLKENFDTSTPIGEMMVIQCISFAQFERKTIVTRIKDGARARAERGLASGSQRLIGYDPDPNRKNHLVVNESEAAIVRLIFEKFIELGSIRKVQDHLNESGYRSKKFMTKNGKTIGGYLWTATSLHRVLTNLSYIGKREVNKGNRNADQEALPETEKYKIVDAIWPGLISQEVFTRAQEMLADNAVFKRGERHPYRLTGLIFCGRCGQSLCGQAATGKTGKFFYYGHNRKFRSQGDNHLQRCENERISAPELEEAVIGRLLHLAEKRDLLADLVKNSQGLLEKGAEELDNLIATSEQERRGAQGHIDNLLSVLAENPQAGAKSLLEKVAEYEAKRDQIAQTIANLKARRDRSDGTVLRMEHAFKLFGCFRKGFEELPPNRQRELLRDVLHKLVVTPDGVKMLYYWSSQEDVLGKIERGESNSPIGPNAAGSHPDDKSSGVVTLNGGGGNRTPVRKCSADITTCLAHHFIFIVRRRPSERGYPWTILSFV